MLKLFLDKDEDKIIREKYNTWNFSFKEMKQLLYEKLITFTKPIQKKYYNITDEEIKEILIENEKKVNNIANKNMEKIYNAIWM